MTIKIDIDLLINETEQLFEKTDTLRKFGSGHFVRPGTPIYEAYQNEHSQEYKVRAMCELIGADEGRVYQLTRFYLKWMAAHGWEKCFPTEQYYKQLLSFICPSQEDRDKAEHMDMMHRTIVSWAERSRKKRNIA